MAHQFNPDVLREYDIRGTMGETLHAADAYAVGRSFATLLRRAGGQTVAVGYDGRISSPMLERALIKGLNASGADVIQIGLGPTPMLYFAEASLEEVQGGIQITGSHNPPDHNGFKLVFQGRPFFGSDIGMLGQIAQSGDWIEGNGSTHKRDLLDIYIDRVIQGLNGIDTAALSHLRIGWDAGNGAAGPALERLVRRLPGEHHLLYTAVDGTFPHHHPDPTNDDNLNDLRTLVAAKNLHFGLAFDGDGDRIVVIDSQGRALLGDQLLMIFAEDLLKSASGATIIADVKASDALFNRVAELGGVPLMWKTGHSHIKSKMKETGSLLAGETTGHMFFADDYYGFDDALYAAVRLIAALARLGKSLTELHRAMPPMINTPELRFQVSESRKFAVVQEIRERLSNNPAQINTTDGIRVTTKDGWWLLRASNTQDMLVARAESRTEAGLKVLLDQIDTQLALSGLTRFGQTVH